MIREDGVFLRDRAQGALHCFGFSAHGPAIDFVIRLDQLDFASAVRRLAQEAGLVAGSTPVRHVPAAEMPRVSPAEIKDERARRGSCGFDLEGYRAGGGHAGRNLFAWARDRVVAAAHTALCGGVALLDGRAWEATQQF